jgi:hypothetical protein
MATRVAAAALLLPLLLVATCCHAQTASNTTQALKATAELMAMLKSALEPGPSEALYQKGELRQSPLSALQMQFVERHSSSLCAFCCRWCCM